MADDFTVAQLQDGTEVHFKGQLSGGEVGRKLMALKASMTPSMSDTALKRSGIPQGAASPQPPPLQTSWQGGHRTPGVDMHREMTAADYLGLGANVFSSSSPGAETALPEIGTGLVHGSRNLGTRGQRMSGAAELIGTGGEMLSPAIGTGALSNPIEAWKLGTGLVGGIAGGEGASAVVRHFGGGLGAQDLAGAIGQFLPMASGVFVHSVSGEPGKVSGVSNQDPIKPGDFFSKDVLRDQANKRVIDSVSAPKDVRDIYASTGMKESHPAETSEQRQQYLRMTKEKGLGPPKTYDPVTGEPIQEAAPIFSQEYTGKSVSIADIKAIRDNPNLSPKIRDDARYLHESVVDTGRSIKDALALNGTDEIARLLGGRLDKTINAKTNLSQTPSLAERQGTPSQAQESSPQQSPSTTTSSEATGKSLLSPEEQLKKSFEKGSNDTEYFRQAKEQLGEGASISDIAKKAQSLKSQRGSSSLAANPFSMAFEAKSALEKLYNEKIADPLIQKLGLGRSHTDIESHDPELADKIRLLDNAPRYFRQKTEAIIKRVVGDLDRDQERGFVLMADRDSRINLMMNHPDEYEQFRSDPAIMAALKRYKPEARLLGDAHEALGGNILNNQDYLSRVYYEHMGGIGKHPDAGNTNIPFERIIKPQKSLNKQRVEDAENYYNYGIHEFGPSFGTKYTGVMIKFARDRVARDFLSKATVIEKDDTMPSSISYQGKQYFSPETASQMREAGEKNINSYGVYSTGLRFYPLEVERIDHSISSTDPIKKTYPGVTSDSRRYLAPREITNTMNGLDAANEGKPSEIKRFFQEQIVGLGFGIPHYKNIMRRVSQTAPLGIANPVSWVRMFKVSFDSELKARALSGTDDPMFDLLAKQGAISSESQISRFKQYIGGNFNPANWVKPIAKIGHDFLFDSGGIDQRARLAMGDLVKSQHPEFSDSRIAQAVNEQLGNYNKRNWTEMQRGLSRFMLFPGWDMSSAAWVIRHPIKTSVPSALVVFMANKAIHSLGYNKESDKNDIFAIHLGTRTIVDNSLNEPLSKVVAGPVLRGAEAKLQGKSWDRAINEASRDFAKDVAKPVTMLRPDLTILPELKVNKDFGTNKPIYGEQDWNRPGLLANKMVDKMALHVVSKLIPQVGHAIEATQDGKFDFTQFLGNNLGIYNYPDDPVISLGRKIAASNTFIASHKQSVTSAQVAASLHSDPDATVYTAFRLSMENQLERLKKIETMRTRVSMSRATDERKEAQYKILDRQKEAEEAQARKLDASIEKTLARIHSRNK